MDKNGEKIHPRSAKILLQENAEYLNREKVCWLTHDFCELKEIKRIKGKMFRYIMPLNRRYKTACLDKQLPYPKAKDLIWKQRIKNEEYEIIDMPNFNMSLYDYNSKNVSKFTNIKNRKE